MDVRNFLCVSVAGSDFETEQRAFLIVDGSDFKTLVCFLKPQLAIRGSYSVYVAVDLAKLLRCHRLF